MRNGSMVLYDFLAPAYDPAFKAIYRPFRERALELLPAMAGASVLDLACGTGQNFSLLASRVGPQGRIIGADISSGMLRRAGRRSRYPGAVDISLLQIDASRLSPSGFKIATGLASIDFVICTYGFTSMRDWRQAFRASWQLLRPGGGYLIHDVDGQLRNLHTRMVEWCTRSDFSGKVWEPLLNAASDFRMDYIDPSAHLFGGGLFAAFGTKPVTTP